MTTLPGLNDACIEALDLVNGLDICLQTGFARLTGAEKERLEALGSAFSGTPLARAVADAVNGLKQGRYDERHFMVLAAARTALLGAIYDDLVQELDTALSLSRVALTEACLGQEPLPIQATIRHTLTELAITGFRHISGDALETFQQTLDRLADEPALILAGGPVERVHQRAQQR